jgi:hypothetical protein
MSVNNIKILIRSVWAFEMILYLQVGFEFTYEHKSERYGNFLFILGCYDLSMDIIIYCFIVLLWKSTKRQKKQLRLPVFKI